MKLIPHIGLNAVKSPLVSIFSIILLSYGCASYKDRANNMQGMSISPSYEQVEVSHTYYLLGNMGYLENEKVNPYFLSGGDKANQTIVFLGDNVSGGLSKKHQEQYQKSLKQLENEVQLAKSFGGNTVFINGNKEWSAGYEGIKRISDYLESELANKKALLPRKVCGFERLKINDETVLIVVDSQWYLEDWNKQPNINEDCDIKTREDFFEELRGEINKNQNRVVLLAMHHPVVSNGNHGGKFSFNDHLFPFESKIPMPLIGSLFNYTRAMSGVYAQDLQSKKYNEFSKHLRTMAQMYENVILVSGHEKNLQYIESSGVKQVISGAMTNSNTAARAIDVNDFTSTKKGYAKIEVLKDRTTWLSFWALNQDKEELIHRQKILEIENPSFDPINEIEEGVTFASVYPQEWVKKTSWYKFLWGEHYRDTYGTPIEVPIADITKINGGLTPTISGGGNQSMSLRLVDKDGKEYVMRGIKKSVARFVQTAVFKDQYVMNSFDNTWAERFIYDFYTTSHPYTAFVLGDLSDKIGLFHTNPKLYYIPKQTALGRFNANYGDELYMIEERPTDGFEEEDSFGNAANIISTSDVIAKLRKDEKYEIDQTAFLRARIFDMLIGDWDRHGDQWRWSEFKEEDKVIYKPIPRDRDQAFAKIDGALLRLIKKLPPLRHMQNYQKSFANPRWLNKTAFPLDQYLLKSTELDDWLTQAEDIVSKLDDESIETAFAALPKEVQGKEVEDIIAVLKWRRDHIKGYLPKYFDKLRQYVVLAGTDKKDRFDIERLENGDVSVKQYRLKKNSDELVFEHVYSSAQTSEIWLYGLNDEDVFNVRGESKSTIRLRLIGGKNQDKFDVANPSKVIVYDYRDKTNEIISPNGSVRKYISNSYDLNNFNYERLPLNVNMLLPNIGYNPEDGVKLGFLYSSTRSKFVQDPYSSKHTLKGFYSFNTKGLEAEYKGYFPNATNNWMFTIGGRATSPNFAINYYGIGNETYYFDNELGKDYKRVRIESYSISPGYRYEGKQGGSFETNIEYEALKVQDKANRFVTSTPEVVNQKVFDFQQYATVKGEFNYEQYNYKANPTVGFGFNAKAGWKLNLRDTDQNFTYLDLQMNFVHFIDRSERLVLATNFNYQTRFNDNYDFYHASTIGGNANLRGFRPERFTGKTSFVQTTDLRYNVAQFTAGFLPLTFGLYGGFDYGRVWTPNENSDKWHNAYGGGIWFTAVEQATIHCSYFGSVDGGRFVFGLGFGF
ncbi:BamA/TamA family outer membrane protein [Myroides sp. LoEW2-1]|uniref:BamA/TamA family outer membrane protein n=1 Tax=Myroides sp. LoEW2-1 TaxID=2683192 RepID=UPI001328B387|nr:metallophosphoesterase [Myroides sp. LoEW2-1]MVX34418.1 metallophosphoesterase [Myroides sp. LoEW2-1]